MKDIKSIKTFAGDIILKTDFTELRINKGLIEEKSLLKLSGFLDEIQFDTKIKNT